MGFKVLLRGTTILLLDAALALPAILAVPRKSAPRQSAETKPQTTAVPVYPESAEGLRDLLVEWINAIYWKDEAKSSGYLRTFAIPNHELWFTKTFGPVEGAHLEARYKELQSRILDGLKGRVEQQVKYEGFYVEVSVFDKASATSERLLQEVSAAMVQPTPIYNASIRKNATDAVSSSVGTFVYVDGGFRYFDSTVMEALGMSPGLRVTVPGVAQAAKLNYSPQPRYPREAIDQKVWGNVTLHVIIAKDGTVRKIQVVSGPPLLVPATIDAVKQWRYQPTLVKGKRVEVDTEVTAIFSLVQ